MNFLEQLLEAHRTQVSEDNWEIFRAGYSACYADMYKQSKKVYGERDDDGLWRFYSQPGMNDTHQAYIVGEKPIAKSQLVDDECQ